jgi:acetyl esterase/lipase
MTMDVEKHLDPEIAAVLAATPALSVDYGTINLAEIAQFRKMMAERPRPELPPTSAVYEDRTVPGEGDQADVTVRITQVPSSDTKRPCVYWIHGGGYLFGTALVEDVRINRWADNYGCVVVGVEYRKSPEHPYPEPLDDCYRGLAWTFEHADELSIDPERVVVVGQSAGGGLAAALALLVRDRHELQIAYQLLIYPMLDDRRHTVSAQMENTPIWSRAANDLGWRAYLGSLEPGSDDVPAYAAAARAADLHGLPPAFVAVGSLDLFRDENIAYAQRLLEAGIPTELHVYPGAPHGFEMIMASAAVAQRCQRDIDDALKGALKA